MDVEIVAIAIAIGLALIPAVVFFQSRNVRLAFVLGWIGLCIGLEPMITAYRASHAVVVPDHRPVESVREDYVSSKECIGCHPREYDTWKHSWHRTMTQVASPESVLADFNDVNLEWEGQKTDLTRQGDQFFARVYDSIAQKYMSREVVMTTGSHHMQLYWYATGRNRPLQEVPFAFLKNDEKWVPIMSLFVVPPSDRLSGQPGLWNNACIHCHTTRGRPGKFKVQDYNSNLKSEAVEFGIACEACHGPGEEHIRANRGNPARRYQQHLSDGGDDTIVNAMRLTNERSVEVCGQCHGIISPEAPDSKVFVRGFDYRAGDVLEKNGRSVMRGNAKANDPTAAFSASQHDSHFWPDGMVRLSGRELNALYDTPCFQADEMTCLSCHTLHQSDDDPRPSAVWADDMLSPGMRTNQACIQCHQTFDQEIESHTHHAENSSGSQCMNCHMPYTNWGLLKASRQHTVDTPSVLSDLGPGRPNACNACHVDQTLQWTADTMASWYGTPVPEMSEDEKTVAATLLWLFKGDAGQRVLAAWYLGWEPAQAVSGTDWIAPQLAPMLQDPYDAVRYVASGSLQSLEGFEDFDYDFLGDETHRKSATQRVWTKFSKQISAATPSVANLSAEAAERVLLYEDGALNRLALGKLLKQRDDRVVRISE